MVLNLLSDVGFEVPTALIMMSSIFWGVTLCSQLTSNTLHSIMSRSRDLDFPSIAGFAVMFKFRYYISSGNGDFAGSYTLTLG